MAKPSTKLPASNPAHANPFQLFEFIGAHGVAMKRAEIRTEREKN